MNWETWTLRVYRYILVPSALKILKFGIPFWNPKIQMLWDEREKAHYLPLSTAHSKAPFWIHCSSGEFEYAKPVIRRLKTEFPDHSVVVTYMSPSVRSSIQNFKEVDIVLPVPWDRPRDVKAFLDVYRPIALLIARTDVWPEILNQLSEHGIPSLLFSATLSDRSSRLRFPGRLFSGLALKQLQAVQCVTPQDKANFTRFLDPRRIEVTGDTRYDQVIYRTKHPKPLKEELRPQSLEHPVLALGSTWPEDERVWFEALPTLKSTYPGLRVLIAPHEPKLKHLEELTLRSKKAGFSTQLYSEAHQWNPDEILLIDEVGILADLYAWGNLAFVGGSFKGQVHSVMEPLAQGLCCLVGPHHLNNREALHFATQSLSGGDNRMVTSVHSPSEIVKTVQSLEPHWRAKSSQHEIQRQIAIRCGATDAVMNWAREKLSGHA